MHFRINQVRLSSFLPDDHIGIKEPDTVRVNRQYPVLFGVSTMKRYYR